MVVYKSLNEIREVQLFNFSSYVFWINLAYCKCISLACYSNKEVKKYMLSLLGQHVLQPLGQLASFVPNKNIVNLNNKWIIL